MNGMKPHRFHGGGGGQQRYLVHHLAFCDLLKEKPNRALGMAHHVRGTTCRTCAGSGAAAVG